MRSAEQPIDADGVGRLFLLRRHVVNETVHRTWALGWLAGGCVLSVVGPRVAESLSAWPFVVGLVVFGMPHGAADWAVLARLERTRGPGSTLVAFLPYMAWVGASVAVICLAPAVATALFLGLTIVHFGLADARVLGSGKMADDRAYAWTTAVGRGGLLLGGVFAVDPAGAWAPFATIGSALGVAGGSWWEPTLGVLRWSGVATLGVAGLCVAGACVRRSVVERSVTGTASDLVEHGLTLALALAAPPLLAVGWYFVGVHGVRHTRRLGRSPRILGERAARADLPVRLWRVHRLALPLLLASLPPVGGLAWAMAGPWPTRLAVGSIAFYMATTLPHHLLGERLERAEDRRSLGARGEAFSAARRPARPVAG